MAALNLASAPRSPLEQSILGTVSTRRLEGALVAPRITKPVPNHLADTSEYLLTCQYTLELPIKLRAAQRLSFFCRKGVWDRSSVLPRPHFLEKEVW